MTIAIYGSRRQEPYLAKLLVFFRLLSAAGARIVMFKRLYDSLVDLGASEMASLVAQVVDDSDFSADVALSIGGDGTFLRTAMWVGQKQIPVLGINTGHLGYLSAASIDDLPAVAAELLDGNYAVERRSLLHVLEPSLPDMWPYALNEVAVSKEQDASVIIAETSINGSPLANYRADGVIVCTPTGSTAYNLSVGGPILQPMAPVWCISPIAAHTLGLRPLVVQDIAGIDITVHGRALTFRIALDGRAATLPTGTTVKVRRAPFCVHLIERPGHAFPAALRKKLHWSE